MRFFWYAILYVSIVCSSCQSQRTPLMPSPYRISVVQPKIELSVWYTLNLYEGVNIAYFRPGFELPRLLIEGIAKGQICAYADETLKKPLHAKGVAQWMGAKQIEDISIPQLHRLGLKREIVYNPNQMMWERSFATVPDLFATPQPRLEHSVLAIYPPEKSKKKVPIYFDMYTVSRQILAAHPRSVYYNPYNPAQAMNFFDALQFRLYEGKISRYTHPKKKYPVTVRNARDVAKLKALYPNLPHFTRGLIYHETFPWKNAHLAYLNSKNP